MSRFVPNRRTYYRDALTSPWPMRRPGSIKRAVYRLGFRPKPGTILYSPSLDLIRVMRDLSNALSRGADGTWEPPPD